MDYFIFDIVMNEKIYVLENVFVIDYVYIGEIIIV